MLNTATAYLALLQENDVEIKSLALDKINLLVDEYWAEISDFIKDMEDLYKRQIIPDKENLLALIISKIYYNLEDYDSAIEWALLSGEKFNLTERSQYVNTLLKKILDKYISTRKHNFFKPNNLKQIDDKISTIVERLFSKCLQSRDVTQAIGLSLETYDLERLTQAIEASDNIKEKLRFVYELTQELIVNNEYKNAIVNTLLRMYVMHANNQYMDITNCQLLLNNSDAFSSTLINILKNEAEPVTAYQIAFDLVDNQNPFLVTRIVSNVKALGEEQKIEPKKLENLINILNGKTSAAIIQSTLNKMNKADSNIIKNQMKAVEKGGSVPHLGVIFANSLLNSHTKNDSFLKDNIEWVAKATNWARFCATASLGVIHMGNVEKGLDVMKPYMPGNSNVPSIYAQAGSYYGLGLIYANSNDEKILNLLIDGLTHPNNNKETVQHGLFLAIGLVAMGTHNLTLYERIRDGVYTDDAIIGEAAGYAIGLIMVGSNNSQAIDDLIKYSHDTQHEKIIRSIAISLALIVYGAEEGADTLIEQLQREKDPILRYGAMYCIGLAYAGTGNTSALQTLIKFSVSDVNDDVRRAALINIGFLQIRNPDILLNNLKVLSLLSESYNSHVRYGAAMAVGISCAGTAKAKAYNVLQPLFNDPSYLVRQAALIATALIFSQTTVTQEPLLASYKENLDKIISNKDEHVLIRMGGLISQGILEIGGRNCTINLVSNSGNNRLGSIIGITLFTQYYYWFPMLHFLNLAVHPCILYGIDSSLKLIKNFQILSKAKPSMFEYPKEVKIQEKAAVQKAQAAVLSTHSRVKAKGRKTGTVTLTELKASPTSEIPTKDEKEKEKPEKENAEEQVQEPPEEVLASPCRILPRQFSVMQHLTNQDYLPIITNRLNGFILLRKVNPDAVPTYYEESVQPQAQQSSQSSGAAQDSNYRPVPTDDVEMPEDIEISNLK